MQALQFWKTVTLDRTDVLEDVLRGLRENGVAYCVIGGQGVNAYADPVVSLDLDLVWPSGTRIGWRESLPPTSR